MKNRQLGKSGLIATEMGLGCWQLGGDFGPISSENAEKVLDAAYQSGIRFWDTADVYGAGASEQHIGDYVKKHDINDLVVATKVGRNAELYPNGYSKSNLRDSLQGSASRLGVECIDLAQLHCIPNDVLLAGDVLSYMEDFQQEGLIHHFGTSVETIAEATFSASHPKLTSVQMIINLFRQDAVETFFDYAQQQDVGVIVRLPLASGVLSGKMSVSTQFSESDHRQYNRNGEAFSQGETFSGVPFEKAVEFADHLKTKVPAGMTMAQMSMRWLLDHAAVTSVISGASRPQQAQDNAAVSTLPALSQELHAELAEYYVNTVKPHICVPI